MKQKKHIGLALFLIIFISIIYIILAVKPLNKEYSFTPVWKISTANPAIPEAESDEKIMNFHLGQTLGYFTENGKVIFPPPLLLKPSLKVAVSLRQSSILHSSNIGQEASSLWFQHSHRALLLYTSGFW